MRRGIGRVPGRRSGVAGTAALVLCAALLAGAGPASAANLFTLDPQGDADSAHVAMDSSGNVYVAWNHTNAGATDTPMFCKFALGSTCTSPVALSLPAPSGQPDNGTSGDFPILGPGNTVYVVGPRYDEIPGDTVLWTSTDGGATFNSGTLIANGYNTTGAESVLLDGSNFVIGGVNVGLSFDSTPISGTPGQTFFFSNPGPGGVASGSLGLDQNGNPVEAYWNLSNPASLDYFYYNGTGSMDSQANWTGPVSLGIGQTPSIAGSSAGLYLLSADGSLASNPDDPTAVDVRNYNATTHTFGPPVTLLTNPESGFDVGGGLAETPAGKVVAIWPDQTAGGNDVLDAFVSTNGGASFSGPTIVANRGASYAGQASVAAVDVGTSVAGVFAFNDANGLELANLAPTVEPTTLTTTQTSGKSTGANITIPAGSTGETDRATVAGINAASATGTMLYGLFSKAGCPASSEVFKSATAVSGGVAAPSAGVSAALGSGTYYWQAGYSGNATNAAAVSTCGSEKLTVSPAASVGGTGTSNGTSVTITVSCASTPCTVTVTITIDPRSNHRPKIVTIATGRFKITKKGGHKLAVRLTAAGKGLLRKDHNHAKATAVLELKVNGHVEKVTRSIRIK